MMKALLIFYIDNMSDKISDLNNKKVNYGKYENKTYYRGDKKDIDIKSTIKNYNTSN